MIVRGNALRLPLADESVDLIVTSPPFWALRSYRDGGEHYDGQLGSEEGWPEFLDNLLAVTAECVRVLKPSGSIFVELGDKYAGSGGHNNAGIGGGPSKLKSPGRIDALHAIAKANRSTRRNAPDRYNQNRGGVRAKSLICIPERYRIRCIDELGLIARATIVWSRLNGLPESVTDRVRRSHSEVVHLTKNPTYYAAVDEIRETYSDRVQERQTYAGREIDPSRGYAPGDRNDPGNARGILGFGHNGSNPLGKLPGSVWPMASEPLRIPEAVKAYYDLPDHFAAFPGELPRRIILGWSPPAICTACGEGRRPVVEKDEPERHVWAQEQQRQRATTINGGAGRVNLGIAAADRSIAITGYACSCWPEVPPTRPSVILDPFSGTGTVVGVAEMLGRKGVGVDLSMDYCRLAKWRTTDSGHFHKAAGLKAPEPQIVGQGALAI